MMDVTSSIGWAASASNGRSPSNKSDPLARKMSRLFVPSCTKIIDFMFIKRSSLLNTHALYSYRAPAVYQRILMGLPAADLCQPGVQHPFFCKLSNHCVSSHWLH